MMINDTVALLISNKLLQSVFMEIAKNRSVQFKDLNKNGVANEQIEQAVTVLKEADLIKESPAPIRDFNMYYVTADGLNASRKLSLAEGGHL